MCFFLMKATLYNFKDLKQFSIINMNDENEDSQSNPDTHLYVQCISNSHQKIKSHEWKRISHIEHIDDGANTRVDSRKTHR